MKEARDRRARPPLVAAILLSLLLVSAALVAQPLSADAGIDRSILPSVETVQLGGLPAASGGTPPYSYSWSIIPGTADVDYTISSTSVANPDFTGLTLDTYTATLTVNDTVGSDIDMATITVEIPDQLVLFNTSLSGTGDYEACIEVQLEQVTVLAGADITLRAPSIVLLDGVEIQNGATVALDDVEPSAGCGLGQPPPPPP